MKLFFLVFLFDPTVVATIISPPVKCYGPVPKISEGKYYFHENGTYLLRISTGVQLRLDLYQRSCFQVDISEKPQANSTASRLTSLLYSVQYVAYKQSYDVRTSYKFGIAELQSYCKCDCPSGETFCTIHYDKNSCSKGDVCITRYHAFQNSRGCDHKGAASMCCEISVKPYKNRRFTAISLVDPRPQIHAEFAIYALYDKIWSLFRRYRRTILPYRGNTLRLNGFENVAELYVHASSDSPRVHLKNGDKWYFFEDKSTFELLDDRRINGFFERDVNKFGWLRIRDGKWTVGNPKMGLHNLQHPHVTNCKEQSYVDTYDVNSANVVVVRNASGSINAEPYLGASVEAKQRFVEKIRLSGRLHEGRNQMALTVEMKPSAAPSLRLDMKLHQKMSIIAHLYASYLEDFVAQICLDKHSERFLNITLIKSYGQFNIEVFRDGGRQNIDLILSMVTNLPFATNYTEVLPLPNFVSSSRLVCVNAANKPGNRLCKWSSFQREPVSWFELKNSFINTEGFCPRCNEEKNSGFLNYLNPKNWLNGIGSFTEGLAVGLEIIVYLFLLLIAVALWRKCFYPLLRWTFCSPSDSRRTYQCISESGTV